MFRAGFACIVGRPNAGKSTLTNALVGRKVAITSDKPQTTRHTIRGLVHREDGQLVIVDTPGVHKPRTLLGERLNELVRATWAEVDVIVMCFPADEPVGPGDRFIAGELAAMRRTPKMAVITKVDRVDRGTIAGRLLEVHGLGKELGFEWAHLIPVSATQDDQIDVLADQLIPMMPESAALYPEGEISDEPEQTLIAELIREAALEGVRDELPHSIAVVIEDMVLRADRPAEDPLMDIYAVLYVERDSQKAIVIGRGGERLKAVGTVARQAIASLLGTKVYLDIRVKVAKDWQQDPKQLRRLGF
ncbi:MAG: GTPase Era [Candidatus Nanopelagicales bacterium]